MVINDIAVYSFTDMNSPPQISNIVIDRHRLKDLKDKLKNPHFSEDAKSAFIKKIVGGFCSRCEKIPTKIVTYDVGGAQLIEKYCNKCFKQWDKSRKEKSEY